MIISYTLIFKNTNDYEIYISQKSIMNKYLYVFSFDRYQILQYSDINTER